GRGVSSRANARDLSTISPLGRNDNPFSFAAFASLREIIRLGCGSAALCLCGENFFTRNPEEPISRGGTSTQHGAKILRGMVRTADRCIRGFGDHSASRGQVCRGALPDVADPCGSIASSRSAPL